ncbi:hypothetical protein DUPY_53460 [Duganella phyllosphaerae]|uniref:DUF3644 domain-containing protein n=2 Tax=Duganella phyllosphaerae TaxID=762836 RepID=A0A1E7W4L5_9BURK|nr:hypothetical protein DUPY_53460 [Duganella phyllosphaerae]
MHAYFRSKKIDYRHFSMIGGRKKYDTTKRGAYKWWELERCLNCERSPVETDAANNLRFLVGLRHEIEHQMTSKIDDLLSARFQACCLNYNTLIKKLFSEKLGIDKHLSFSLQLSSLSDSQVDMLSDQPGLPKNIQKFIEGFDGALSREEFNSPKYAYRVLFVAKTANNFGQADRVIQFVKPGSELAEKVNTEYTLLKEIEKVKYLPSEIIDKMKTEGFKFTMHDHTLLWKKHGAKEDGKNFGTTVSKTWYWYESWVNLVRQHCEKHREDQRDIPW